jgi:hypothetical protein
MLQLPASGLLGKRVLNGCGALLGEVVRVVGEPDGPVREIVVRQRDSGKEWVVEAHNIRQVADAVQLKGPREGYHIAPLPASPAG